MKSKKPRILSMKVCTEKDYEFSLMCLSSIQEEKDSVMEPREIKWAFMSSYRYKHRQAQNYGKHLILIEE